MPPSATLADYFALNAALFKNDQTITYSGRKKNDEEGERETLFNLAHCLNCLLLSAILLHLVCNTNPFQY